MEKLPLVGLSEIAMRAGVQKPVVAAWRTRHDTFPQPVAELRAGAVWWWPEVEAWLKATGREHDAGWTLEQITPHRRGFTPVADVHSGSLRQNGA